MSGIKLFIAASIIAALHIGFASEYADAADPVKEQAQQILKLIEENKWDQAVEPADGLKTLYLKNKWKYQLLGDEGEYEELKHEIDKLRTAVREQDSTQVKIMIATILSIIEEIYSL